MKITLVVATSLDGKITMGDNPDVHVWTSPEDTEHFRSFLQSASLITMGRKTYDAMKDTMKHKPGRLRIVFTRDPHEFEKERIEGQLEFTSEAPKELVDRLSVKFKEMLLVSGAEVTTAFFKAGLIDEIYQTLEPWIFGAGKPVVLPEDLNIKLQLIDMKKLNEKGTLLLHYKVKK